MKRQPWLLILAVYVSMVSCNLGVTSGGNASTKAASGDATTESAIIHQTISAEESSRTSATATAGAMPTPSPTSTATAFLPRTIQVDTRYEGTKEYVCDEGGCWRTDGQILFTPERFFPDIENDNPEIQALLADFQLSTVPTTNDKEQWERTIGVWSWLSHNTLDLNAPGGAEPYQYLKSLSYDLKPPHSPSIGDMAKVYARYRIISWTGCTARALTFATFLYRFGIPPQEMAVAEAQWQPTYSQHLYLVMRVGGQWRYVDPSCVELHPALSALPESVGCTPADYEHPVALALLPGSTLTKPMLVQAIPIP